LIHRRPRIDQILVGAVAGDAIFDQALHIRDWLRSWGYRSCIYAYGIDPRLPSDWALPYTNYQPASRQDILLFHYSIGSPISDYVKSLGSMAKIVMIYHNITPPEYFEGVGGPIAMELKKGREEIADFVDMVQLALADSEFNRLELIEAGYERTGVLPLAFDVQKYSAEPNRMLLARFDDEYVNILFVGRMTPNKKHEDIIKIFYHYREINPRSRLFLVGTPGHAPRYAEWLEGLVAYLGLDDVHFCGHVPFDELLAYYRLADLFLCMSEHEGFCLPLIESIYFGIPIVAYNSTAIPYTLGGTGVLIKEKRYDIIAQLIELLITDQALRHRIVTKQRERLREFGKEKVMSVFRGYVEQVIS